MGGTVVNSTTSYKPKLPKLSVAKFKGEVTKWNTFWDSFESAIHNNNDISKIDKFNYLNSLLEGIALRAVQGLTLTGANYDAAIEILQDRFGQPQQIITAHMDELLKIPASSGDRLSSLRFVYDKISVHLRALASLGVSSDQYGSLLIPIILSKMPGDIRLQIARKAKKDAWKIDDLLQIIKFELEAREISETTKWSEKSGLFTSSHKRDGTKQSQFPTAINSKLGWLLSGPAESSSSFDQSTTSNLILTENDPHLSIPSTKDSELADSLRRFWETESIGISEQQSKNDREERFLRNIRHTGERYEVGLPWKEDRPAIDNDRELCLSRLYSLHYRLKRDEPLLTEYDKAIKRDEPLLTEYDKAIKDQLASGIIEEIPHSEPHRQENTVRYIPHHAVIREDKKTTKIRVVYDGSATTNDCSFSLNDCLPAGPNYVPQLFNILVKFRAHQVGLIADIEKAFLMIGIEEIDRDMMRFLWFENAHDPNPKVAEFRFTRLMFGLRSSPAILGATINHHLEFYKETQPETVKAIRDSLYVDDLVSGAPKDDQAFEIYQNTKRVMSDGGFNLRKWCSNSASLVEAIDKAEAALETTPQHQAKDEFPSYAEATTNPDSNVLKDKCAKVLGSIWDMSSDEFLFNLSSIIDYSRTFSLRNVGVETILEDL